MTLEFGIFDQEIRNGWQAEIADRWLRLGNPWEIAHPEIRFDIQFGGRTEPYLDIGGSYRVRWIPDDVGTGTVSGALDESEVRITAKRSSANRIRTATPADHTTGFSFSHFCSSSLGTAECYAQRCSISVACLMCMLRLAQPKPR